MAYNSRMLDANRRIEALAKSFVAQFQEIAKEELLHMLGGAGGSTTTRSSQAAPARKRAGGRGQKRSSERLEQLQAKFHAFVAKNPGLRIEQINAKLGTRTKDLQLPIRKLIAGGQIKAKGTKRSTTYSVGAKGKK